MFDLLVYVTGLLCLSAATYAYSRFRDVFHPALVLMPMCAFVYVGMPLYLSRDGRLWSYVTEEQATRVQAIILVSLALLVFGLLQGSNANPPRKDWPNVDQSSLHKGAYAVGALGFAAWLYGVRNSGGLTAVFGRAKGIGWSEYGYIREAAYLIIVALLLLMSPQGFRPKDRIWLAAVTVLSLPYLAQGLLGAQRGPTFLIVGTLVMSFYLARGRRPSLPMMASGAVALGFLLLFLVVNRGAIYIGSEQELTTDVSGFMEASEANEYIFGAGCITAADQTNRYFWGKRYLAQILVRPIPKQIWPTKYEDFGVPELLQNAGVAGGGLQGVMGWKEEQGAAAAMVADIWVEMSFLTFAAMWLIGYLYGVTWKKAVLFSGPWVTQYTILTLLSIYMVSQSGEAVIFRLVILSVPAWIVWKKSQRPELSRQYRVA